MPSPAPTATSVVLPQPPIAMPALPMQTRLAKPPGGEMGWLPAALIAGGIFGGFLLLSRPSPASHLSAGPATAAAAELPIVNAQLPAQLPPPPPIAEAIFNLTAPRWPAAFDAPAPAGEFRIPARLLPRNALADMRKTYEFYAGQAQFARILATRFPAMQSDLGEAQSQFEARYSPAVKNIDQLVGAWNADAGRQMHQSADAAARKFDLDAGHATAQQAHSFATELRRRARGRMASPMAETFLAFDPVYVANPAREFDDGYVNTYRAPDAGASSGVRIAFVYPRSWQAAAGSGLLVQHFHDRRSGLVAATISADYLPNPAITRPQQLKSLLSLVDLLDSAPDARLLDAGIVVLPDGKQALWRECTFTRTRGSAPYRMKAVDFTLVCGEKYVEVGFTAGVDASAPEADLDSAYRRNAPLYKRMICDATVGG